MTFVPLLGYYVLRPERKQEKAIEVRRTTGFSGWYARTAKSAMEHRWKVFAGSLVFLALGVVFMARLKTSFKPNDNQYWSYIAVWLPNDSSLQSASQAAQQVEEVIRREAEKFGTEQKGQSGASKPSCGYFHLIAAGAGSLRNLCSRFENPQVGNERGTRRKRPGKKNRLQRRKLCRLESLLYRR